MIVSTIDVIVFPRHANALHHGPLKTVGITFHPVNLTFHVLDAFLAMDHYPQAPVTQKDRHLGPQASEEA